MMAGEGLSSAASKLLGGLTIEKKPVNLSSYHFSQSNSCGQGSVNVQSAVAAPLRADSCVPPERAGEEMNAATQRL